jgi:hypothetical protein
VGVYISTSNVYSPQEYRVHVERDAICFQGFFIAYQVEEGVERVWRHCGKESATTLRRRGYHNEVKELTAVEPDLDLSTHDD